MQVFHLFRGIREIACQEGLGAVQSIL